MRNRRRNDDQRNCRLRGDGDPGRPECRRAGGCARSAPRAPAGARARRRRGAAGHPGELDGAAATSAGERALDEIARDIGDGTEKRIMLGDRAEALAQVAAEEGADLIVIGSRPAGLGNRKLRCTLARELEAATPIPVVVAPPATRKRTRTAARAGGRRGHALVRSVAIGIPMRFSRLPLLWRVFAINAALLVDRDAAARADAGHDSRARSRSSRGSTSSWPSLVMLAANLLLLRHTLAPIDRLVERMRTVDLLRPGPAACRAGRRRGGRAGARLQRDARAARDRAARERPARARTPRRRSGCASRAACTTRSARC